MSVPVALPVPARLSVSERLLGHLSIAAGRLVLAVLGGRPDRLVGLLGALARGAPPATVAEAEQTRVVVTSVSPVAAGPHGCLLRTVAVVLVCRWWGSRVTWRLGVRASPPTCHAWVEAAGQPVGEHVDPRLLHTPILTV